MTHDEAIKHLENMKWLKGYDNTTVGGMPLGDIIDQIIVLLKEQKDEIRILTADLDEVRNEHEQLLDKKIPMITNGQEVAPCKDCKHGERWGALIGCGTAKGFGIAHKPDWFCADGERR